MAQVVVLEDSVIMRMLTNSAFLNAFPFLNTYAAKLKQTGAKRGCRPCQKNKKVTAADMNAIRFAIFGMSNAQKIELKRMLNAAQIKMYYKNVANQVVKVTF